MNASPRSPSLLPREHGAYAELAFPQGTALILGGGGLPALLIAAAVVCGFLLHEPALVMAGRRGTRSLKAAGARAGRWVALLIALAAVCGLCGLLLSSPGTRTAMAGVVVLGIFVAAIIAARREQSLGGLATVAVTFAAASVPTALAGGVPFATAAIQAGVWAICFVLGTVTVNVVIGRPKRRSWWEGPSLVAASILLALTAAWLGTFGGGYRAFTAVIPVALVSCLAILLRMTPRRLRRLGWSMVAANTATLILLLLLLT